MRRRTRQRWQAATSLADLGALTALWLEGQIDSQPGWQSGHGPDPETAGIVPALAAANRAGYLTQFSQPGFHDADEPAVWAEDEPDAWSQRAAVEGWLAVDQAAELVDVARDAGLIVSTHPVVRNRFARHDRAGLDVTTHHGQPVTIVGRQYRRHEVEFQYPEVSQAALDSILRSTQVTITAPEYGPHEQLWQILTAWAGDHR